ncbi:hypothetical protein [Streptomyces sp. BE133]|nr:hypothetical protein [Streptomyces sp. BE133]MEE1812671.1 hypothetical protein [Streptomyces sp. BE133]
MPELPQQQPPKPSYRGLFLPPVYSGWQEEMEHELVDGDTLEGAEV